MTMKQRILVNQGGTKKAVLKTKDDKAVDSLCLHYNNWSYVRYKWNLKEFY